MNIKETTWTDDTSNTF